MKTRLFIGFLFVCIVPGFQTQYFSSNDDILTSVDHKLYLTYYHEQFKDQIMYVYDDNRNLIRLTLDDVDDQSIIGMCPYLSKCVLFNLYTLKNPTSPQSLNISDENSIKNSNFDPKKPTRFITHGWMNSGRSEACTLIRDAYIKEGDYNVIVIDWSKITLGTYAVARSYVRQVGIHLSGMINLLEEHGMDLSKTLLVGHSLGAHVVGIAARNAKGNVKYVIGLDPALPLFYIEGPGYRISKGDADYVEIIHTNAGLLGFLASIGDSDFFPNGGSKQRGCIIDVGGACSHSRSYEFFAESINSSKGFHGKRCDSFSKYITGLCNNNASSLMGGIKKILKSHGDHYLKTKRSFPFAMGL